MSQSTPEQQRNLPAFFVLGAQKAGTTTLHHWLTQQPPLALPKTKETHYFSHDDRYSRSLDWYLRQFPEHAPGRIMGEVDPEYLYFPQAAERMARLGLHPRFVVIVRDPLARAYSQYRMSVLRGIENLSFPDALRAEAQRLAQASPLSVNHHCYLARGRYSEQIRRVQGQFPDAPMLVVGFDELFAPETRSEAYGRICRFIGLERPRPLLDGKTVRNPAQLARWRFLNGVIWDKSKLGLLRNLFHIVVPFRGARGFLARTIYAANQRSAPQQADWLEGVDEVFIQEANTEAKRLAEAFGIDTSAWLR